MLGLFGFVQSALVYGSVQIKAVLDLLSGYLVMTDNWFSEFVFELVVDKKFVPDDVIKVLDQEPIVLPAWDPMGTLAKL